MTRRALRRAVATGVVALSACGTAVPPAELRVGDATGRGLQPPWWTTIPAPDPKGEPKPIEIPADALFSSGSSEVRPDDRPRLGAFGEQLARRIEDAPGTWLIVGATDSTGDGDANFALGQARADAVAEIITYAAPIDPARLRTRSWGEYCPAVDESTAPDLAQARAQNRRVVIVPPGSRLACRLP